MASYAVLPLAALMMFSSYSGGASGPECPLGDDLGSDVLLPNPEDCTSFYACSNGVPILMRCPDGLHFNSRMGTCEVPVGGGCDPSAGGGTIIKGHFLNCIDGGVTMVVIPKGGSVTVFGVTITGQAGSTRHIAWELWSCVKGNDNDNCDTSQAGIRVK